MGKKYSINSAGFIVAERDIYSLGGFIPKGSVGGKVANELQLSQDGECWLAGGDISGRPDIRIKDNAYIADLVPGTNPVHTDGITELSGNTKIPGRISIRCFTADTKNNVFIKDSFIGISMDVLFGVSSKCHPVEQGQYNKDAPKGTLFTSSSMKLDAANCVRNTATIRLGKDTYLYTPAGYNARVFWAYYDTSNQLAFSGETHSVSTPLTKLDHPVYKLCMVFFAKSPTLTPAELETSGARVIGHASGSVLTDLRPESTSGEYVMDGSKFISTTDNFGLATTQLRFLAGGMYNTNMYTKTDRQDYKPYGTFRNVERLEYNQYFADIHRGNANRDHYIKASDCPLIRISEGFVSGPLVNAGGVTLRNCIVPKASFTLNKVLGNTYEDIDFSYAQEHIGKTHAGRTLRSSHMQGHYDLFSGEELTGVISRPENLDNTARLTEDHINIQLDGDLIEQGSYNTGSGYPYENYKSDSGIRVRIKTPLATRGVVFPTLPPEYKMKAVLYLDDEFIVRSSETDVTELKGEYPYFVASFRKADDSAITVKEFISKGLFIQSSDYTKYPIISGSGYVGANVTVRGDVEAIGQPYVKRFLDVNEWEKGSIRENALPQGWEAAKNPSPALADWDRRRLKGIIPVEYGAKILCNSGYSFNCYVYASDGTYLGTSNWSQSWTVTPGRAAFVGIIFKKVLAASDPGLYIEDSDIPLAGVRYVTEFKTARYITNELDRKDPSDIFLGQDVWQVASVATGSAYAGREYDSLIGASNKWCIIKRPINAGKSWTVTLGNAVTYAQGRSSWDALTKLLGSGVKDNVALSGLELKKVAGEIVTLLDVPAARFVVEYIPTPRIIVPYGVSNIQLERTRVRLYDNAVLSKTITSGTKVILKGNAVLGDVPGACVCSNGHDDAIIKLP